MKLLKFPSIMCLGLLLSCTQEKMTSSLDDQPSSQKQNIDTADTSTSNVMTIPANTANTGDANPPHGEPGHRCDIEVGAPLSSAPAVAQPITPAAAPIQTFNTNSTVIPSAKPTINPPHGEPHHRCDIEVGAPLT